MRATLSLVRWGYQIPKHTIYSLLEDNEVDAEAFNRRLIETITWCKPRISPDHPATCLRSPELTPTEWFNPEYSMMFPSEAEPVLNRRSQLLTGGNLSSVTETDLQGGKLLVFLPLACLYEGAVYSGTNGFIGEKEEPPWDTWVYYGDCTLNLPQKRQDEYLISWIPPEFVGLVNSALDMMSAEWLWWIEKIEFDA